MLQVQSLGGLVAFIGVCWLISENRQGFPWRLVIAGLFLQVILAAVFLTVPAIRDSLQVLNGAVTALQNATGKATSFVFGYAGGGSPPFVVTDPNALVSIAFGILPLVIVMSALSALLWHWRILPLIVQGFAFVLERTMRIGGALGFGAAANIFLGMTESPLLIRPYLERLTRSELFALFACGLSNVAGTVMVIYAAMLGNAIPGAIGHILVASVLSLPASILLAKIMIPGDEATSADPGRDALYRSSMDAVTRGTEDGMRMYLSIIAMLIAVTALVALANAMLGTLSVDGAPLTFERLAGWVFAPIAYLMGIPYEESVKAGSLLGIKTVLNEFIAYQTLASVPAEDLAPRSRLIMLYGLCGFANLASVGILIAGMSALVPSRKDEIVGLALKSLIPGTLATCMTGAVVGLLTTG
ncbi:MAG TPA: nucleoside:proton symporter [Alphaproteobacteria bacterium]|nr:nucleoside:proton symporter [Alphaproteobacteria bacterium]